MAGWFRNRRGAVAHRALGLLVGLSLLAAGCSSDPGRPVIVDYSPTVSDVGALLYLLSHPEIDVAAITMPSTGEAGCELGLAVTLGILAMFGQEDIPVACDGDRPDEAEEWPSAFLAGSENLRFRLPQGESLPDGRPAHRLIADVIAESSDPVTLFAVAPLTNVARALDAHPELVADLERIVIMGGAVDVPGNVGGSDAEWNFFIDAAAAARVISSGAPITLVPLDATNHVPVPAFWPQDLQEAEQSPAVAYLEVLVRAFPAVTGGFFYLWDELAASVAAGETHVTTGRVRLVVEQDGSTVRNDAGAEIEVATAVRDPAGYYADFLSTLAGAPVTPRPTVAYDEESAPASIGPASPPEEVLAYWVVRAMKGDVVGAHAAVVPGAPWVGIGSTPAVFVDGAEPYNAFDIELTCTSDGSLVSCSATWNDWWLAEIPELDRGELTVLAEVVAGRVAAFHRFDVGAEVAAAFQSHLDWLAATHPEGVAAVCDAEFAGRDCSRLIVRTAAEWVASR